MRELQDNFYEKVAMRSGLTRLGPARTRDTRQVWKAKQQNAEALAKKLKAIEDTKKVAASGYRAGVKREFRKPKPRRSRSSPRHKESQGVGKVVGRSSQWLARAKRESQGRGYQGQGRGSKGSGRGPESPRRCRKVKAKAKKEADQRVATVANQLTEERTKTKDLEEELRKAQEQANDLAKRLALYEDPTKGTDHNGGASSRSEG